MPLEMPGRTHQLQSQSQGKEVLAWGERVIWDRGLQILVYIVKQNISVCRLIFSLAHKQFCKGVSVILFH